MDNDNALKTAVAASLIVLISSSAIAGCEDFSDPDMRAGCEMREQLMPKFDDDGRQITKNWSLLTRKSKMTDDTNIFLSVESNETAQCNFNTSNEKVTLVLRCLENTTTAYIQTPCHVASGFQGYGNVTYRVDKNTSKTKQFAASTSNDALGLWSYRKSRPFIDEIFGGKSLLMRFTPFGESAHEVSFDITGIEEEIQPLREACGW